MLTIEGVMPCSWRALDAAAAAALASRFDAHNERVLRILQIIETGGSGEHRDETGGVSDLNRLEAKIDMVIEMLGEMIDRDRAAPAALPVRLSAESLTLRSSSPPAADVLLEVEIIINPRLPKPLQFITRVTAITPDVAVDAGAAEVTLDIVDMAPAVREELERQIFLLHRRSLSRREARQALSQRAD